MNVEEAAKILETPIGATPEQLEARFLELRGRLEERIAKAPTAGLKEKYRAALAEVTSAYETLAMAADTSRLPVLRKTSAVGAPQAVPDQATVGVGPERAPKAKSGKEFYVVLGIAIVVLGFAGWWIVRQRAEAAEKARVEALAKAEAERAAEQARLAAEKAKAEAERLAAAERARAEKERQRQEALHAQLRASQAELKLIWDGIERGVGLAERKLADLKSDLRDVRDLPGPRVAELRASYSAQGQLVDWMQSYVTRHLGKTQLARLDALLGAKAISQAEEVEADARRNIQDAEKIIGRQAKELLVLTSVVEINSEPAGQPYTFTDAYGRIVNGATPFVGELPLGTLSVQVTPPSGWSKYEQIRRVVRGEPLKLNAVFSLGRVDLKSEPLGLAFIARNPSGYELRGVTPAVLTDVPTGDLLVTVTRPDWPDEVVRATVDAEKAVEIVAKFVPGMLAFASTPSGAKVRIANEVVGVTPLTLEGLSPGEKQITITKGGYFAVRPNVMVRSGKTVEVSATLRPFRGLALPDNPSPWRSLTISSKSNFKSSGVNSDSTWVEAVDWSRSSLAPNVVTVSRRIVSVTESRMTAANLNRFSPPAGSVIRQVRQESGEWTGEFVEGGTRDPDIDALYTRDNWSFWMVDPCEAAWWPRTEVEVGGTWTVVDAARVLLEMGKLRKGGSYQDPRVSGKVLALEVRDGFEYADVELILSYTEATLGLNFASTINLSVDLVAGRLTRVVESLKTSSPGTISPAYESLSTTILSKR